MLNVKRLWKLLGVLLMVASGSHAFAQKVVVAHRGASGYLPEHTLEAKAMAYAMGAHYIEQDVVMSKDDQLIVLHDVTLDRTTDVAEKFPGRAREDGRHYVVDFTLEEMRTLRVSEGVRNRNGTIEPIYDQRFPVGRSRFEINTLAEEIEMIQGLNRSTGGNVGIYPEVKSPAFHHEEGKDVSSALIAMLKEYGYTTEADPVFVQTFEFEELKRLHDEVMPGAGVSLKLVQLMADDEAFEWMLEDEGMATVARYASGIGPDKGMIIAAGSATGSASGLVALAHDHGLDVHPYTFRLDPGQVPAYAQDFEDLLSRFYFDVGVDGLFTDFPDRAVQFLNSRSN